VLSAIMSLSVISDNGGGWLSIEKNDNVAEKAEIEVK